MVHYKFIARVLLTGNHSSSSAEPEPALPSLKNLNIANNEKTMTRETFKLLADNIHKFTKLQSMTVRGFEPYYEDIKMKKNMCKDAELNYDKYAVKQDCLVQ